MTIKPSLFKEIRAMLIEMESERRYVVPVGSNLKTDCFGFLTYTGTNVPILMQQISGAQDVLRGEPPTLAKKCRYCGIKQSGKDNCEGCGASF